MAIRFNLDLSPNIGWDQLNMFCVEKFNELKDKFFQSFNVIQLEAFFDFQKNVEGREIIRPYLTAVFKKQIHEDGFYDFFISTCARESMRHLSIDVRISALKEKISENDLGWLLEQEAKIRGDKHASYATYTAVIIPEILAKIDENISIANLKQVNTIMNLPGIPPIPKNNFQNLKRKLVKGF